jgi:aspartate aminotransferase-like enzyme
VYGDAAADFFDGVAGRNVSVSGGQAHLGGQIFRVSNRGQLSSAQIERGVRVVVGAIADAGVDVDIETGLAVARDRLDS